MGPVGRGARAAALALALASAAGAQRREAIWPMANGRHDVLHSFQNPFVFGGRYFHEGVDLRGSRDDVLAVRGGTVRYRNQNDAGGTLVIAVQTPHGLEADSYLHIRIGPWFAGDLVEAGDVIGTVSDSYFPFALQDHVHVNRFSEYHGGNNYVTGRTNMLHPLELFHLETNRDPQDLPARPIDLNHDGSVFRVTRPGDPDTALAYASGAVELLLEAADRQSDTLYFDQGLVSVGYWIEALGGGEDVASAGQPYRLVRFSGNWRATHPDCDSLVARVMVSAPPYWVDFGPDDTGWESLATYRLTRAAGFTGSASDISAAQAWHTEARTGTGLANGTDGLTARDLVEARFPDGLYRVHALTEDLTHHRDSSFDVRVDNFAPYVASLRIRNATRGGLLLEVLQAFDPLLGRRVLRVGPQGRIRAVTESGDRLEFEVRTSEAMADLEWATIAPELGVPTPWVSDQPDEGRTLFRSELRLERPAQRTSLARLRIRGHDPVGRELLLDAR